MVTTQRLLQFARDYADFVSRGDLDGVLSILEPEPVFDLYPIARRFSGKNKIRRYFQHFFKEVQPRISAFTPCSELIGEGKIAHEYDITMMIPSAEAPSSHRVFAMIIFGSDRVNGERIYADEKMLRLLIGPLWNSLEPIPAM